MTDPSAGRVALVTGGSRGIGAATATALARSGHRVAVGSRGSEEAHAVVEQITADGGVAEAVTLDVTDPAAVDTAVTEIEAAWGPVAVLVSNAGATGDGLVARMSDERWRSALDTNLDGAFHVIRRVTGPMMRARWGRIVTVSSVVALSGSGGQANYAAAKAGLIGLTRSVARELAPRQITANVVAPGPIATAMTDALPDDRRDAVASAVPLGRFGAVAEVAAVVDFLASDAAAYVTGAIIPVDGGLGMGH